LIQSLEYIKREEIKKEDENFYFKEFLRQQDEEIIDALVKQLNEEVTPQIDCTTCGNCCKSLMINITKTEADKLAEHLNMRLDEVKEKYIETSLQGEMVINTIPCHFLTGTSCGIYEQRFTECREFPGLNKNNFNGRLFSTFMHYGRCPIIYNVIEELKKKLSFLPVAVSIYHILTFFNI
jgi:Fe-S-cluster containining protein